MVYYLLLLGALLTGFYTPSGSDGVRKDDFPSVELNGRDWMTSNLNVSTFQNGDSIPQAHNMESWLKAGKKKKPAWCYYNFDATNGQKHGKLYNWYAVSDERGLAPRGWKVPTSDEFEALVSSFIDVNQFHQFIEKFQVSYSGYLHFEGNFESIDTVANFWMSDQYKRKPMFCYSTREEDDSFNYWNFDPKSGLSVRCVKE